ncbi:uncharacterized protein LOC121187565 isoform X2 [Toxotes jaculatrix]|uniref:uncharacterized protein LOC121187565 isoform X2 n=1 Tax=Toxotes jaculatrix TaxID=941984 RepID=UPI001B3AB8F4|nr:uncharacterized protein LOC121187565 isoform X2 [Toxotes jaculatrix]
MIISVHFTFLFLWVTQDFGSCVNMKIPTDFLTVVLGDSLTLNCTYNCSTGFVRGCWKKAFDSGCLGILSKSSFCTRSLRLSNVSTEDLERYTCYTENTEDPQFRQKIQRIVLLQLEAQTRAPNWTVTPKTETKNASLPAKPKDSSGGEFTGIKVLAAVTVAVAMVLAVLAAYLCLNRSRQSWNGEPVVSRSCSTSHAVFSPVKGSLSAQSERVTLRIPTSDHESDTEVPYADIMITVRGVSTPELTQVGYLTAGDQKEWLRDESRSHLQASRSADRLHVPLPREVSRKMSTNSEYAVITYA